MRLKYDNVNENGVQVTEECNNTGKIMRTLTIGEALEMLPKMVKELYAIDNADSGFSIGINKALTTKDGGIVEVNDEK